MDIQNTVSVAGSLLVTMKKIVVNVYIVPCQEFTMTVYNKDTRYQNQPNHIQIYRWMRWMPYAYIRACYWYIFQKLYDGEGHESLHSCIDISVGSVQAGKMNWVYSMEEIHD